MFLLQMIDKVGIQLSVHQQHIVSFGFCLLDITELLGSICSIEGNDILILIRLIFFYQSIILFKVKYFPSVFLNK